MQTTTRIGPGIAENAVRAARLAAGHDPALDDTDRGRCLKLTEQCAGGLLTRAEIVARLDDIAGAPYHHAFDTGGGR